MSSMRVFHVSTMCSAYSMIQNLYLMRLLSAAHSAPVTTAVFAPVPGITVDEGLKEVGEMVVAADYQGSIKIYVSGEKL